MKTIHLLYALFTIVLLAACSSSPSIPSEADAQREVEQEIQKNSNGLIRLTSFKKTNALNMEGVNSYIIEYTAELEFLDDCTWDRTNFSATRGIEKELSTYERAGKKGERQSISSQVNFQKTEKGWRPQP